MTLRVRWLGRVPDREALDLQTSLFEHGHEQHLLLLEHPHVFTHGARAELDKNVLVDPASVGAELVAVNDAALVSLLNDQIRSIPGVTEVETFIYLKLSKQTFNWGTR